MKRSVFQMCEIILKVKLECCQFRSLIKWKRNRICFLFYILVTIINLSLRIVWFLCCFLKWQFIIAPDLLNSDIFPLLGFFYQNYAVAILIILELPPTWRQNLRLSHGGNQVLRHAWVQELLLTKWFLTIKEELWQIVKEFIWVKCYTHSVGTLQQCITHW